MNGLLIIVGIGLLAWIWLGHRHVPEFGVHSEKEERLAAGLMLLRKNKSLTNAQYRKVAKVSEAQATRDLDLLERAGVIVQQGKVGRFVKYVLR
ncbi:MAG: hypothetical protein PHR51_02520 [Patescibacteria group bacterium]|nr:hypothetical protein [Patescibacteria group bacterium]